MLNFPTLLAKFAFTIIFLTIIHPFLFDYGTSAQQLFSLTSPFNICWKYETENTANTNTASDNEKNIYVSLLGGKLASINSANGKLNWESTLGGEIMLVPSIDKNNIFIVSNIKEKVFIRSLSLDSGITNWQISLAFNDVTSFVKIANKLILVSKSGEISALDSESGKTLWNTKIKLILSSPPIILENQIVLSTKARQILFFSAEDGTVFSRIETSTEPTITSMLGNNKLFWGDHKGNAYLIDLLTRKILWNIRSGAEISNVLIINDAVLISSLDNFIYFVSTEKGKIIWKKRFNGRFSITTFADNKYFLVLTPTFGSVDIVDVKDGKIVNQIVIDESNYLNNNSIVLGGFIILSTVKGLFAYENSEKNCVE